MAVVWSYSSPEAKKERHLKRADTYFEDEKYNEAIIEYRNVVQIDPKYEQAYYKLGLCYLRTGKGQEAYKASEIADEVLEEKPKDLYGRLLKGQLYLRDKDVDKTIETFQVLIKKEPRLAMAHYLFRVGYLTKGSIYQAREELIEVLKYD